MSGDGTMLDSDGFAAGAAQTTLSSVPSSGGAREWDPAVDAYESWLVAIREIGRRVKAGEEPLPTTGYFAVRQ